VPAEVRDRLGLVSGTAVEFLVKEGEVIMRKRRADDPIDRVYGTLRIDKTVDEAIEEMRGPGPRRTRRRPSPRRRRRLKTAVDTSVLLDVLTASPQHGEASREALRAAYRGGGLIACDVVWGRAAVALRQHHVVCERGRDARDSLRCDAG